MTMVNASPALGSLRCLGGMSRPSTGDSGLNQDDPQGRAAAALAALESAGGAPLKSVEHAEGALLLRQGERGRPLLLLQAGRVGVSCTSPQGTELAFVVRGAGDWLNLTALQGEAASGEVRALAACAVVEVPVAAARSARDSGCDLLLEAALASAENWRRDRLVLAGRAGPRLARVLLAWNRDGATPPPQRVLARVLGMRAETLSRAAADLRKQGALGVGLTIGDASRLRRIAESA